MGIDMSSEYFHRRDMKIADAAGDVTWWLRAAQYYLHIADPAPATIEVSSALHDKLMANVSANYPLGADVGLIGGQLMIRSIPIKVKE